MTLYHLDFYRWTQEAAAALREQRLSAADAEKVADEIESMGKRDFRELSSRLERILEHKLKLSYLPAWTVDRNQRLWLDSIDKQQTGIRKLLNDSPSLRACVEPLISESYNDAARRIRRLFPGVELPVHCPWTVQEVLE
ncbi:MAG: DUF29 domain-containing protein [Acidobacteriia bacterium]|nr:DUF29 domain-containing protein [Terriglobia bacterium]